MTLTDTITTANKSRESFSCIVALNMLAAFSYLSTPAISEAALIDLQPTVKYEVNEYSTNQAIEIDIIYQTKEFKLFSAINEIYDKLLTDQKELDSEAKDILYSNLWDLYE